MERQTSEERHSEKVDMNISRSNLYRIVLEEYAREEGLSEDKVDDLIAHIKGGPKPDWIDDDKREIPDPPEVPAPESSETYPMEIPGRQAMSADELAITIGELVHGRDPEEVSEIFQMAFEKLPGVELSKPGDEDYPGEETLYTPGAEGRPSISLGPLREHIGNRAFQKILEMAGLSYGLKSMAGMPGSRDDEEEEEEVVEGEYHDMGGEGEVYDVLDPEGLAQKSDAELVNMIWAAGAEKTLVLDGEGDLANREEVIITLKNV